MKNVQLLFVLLTTLMLSCSADSEDVIILADLTLDNTTKTSILSELETVVSEEMNVLIKYENSKVLKIDNEYYLRARSGDYVTTTSLIKDKKGGLQSRGVSCTTEACSHIDSACRPTEDRVCTPCPEGDCKKTVTCNGCIEDAEISGF